MRKWLFSNGTSATSASLGLLVLRVGIGALMMSLHGWSKYQNFAVLKENFTVPKTPLLSTWMNPATSLACTVFAEVACCALIMVGLATRPAAAVLAFTMGIATFVVLGDQPLPQRELGLLYLTTALTLVFTGAGAFSFDARLCIVKKRMFR
ncbi:MAG: hypothetical protein RLZZ224_1830 [Verrucomicrobiota bacterium]|jgi:putative oxidoreductase